MHILGLEGLWVKPAIKMNLDDAVKILSTAAQNQGFRAHLKTVHKIENPNADALRALVKDQFNPEGTSLRRSRAIAWEIDFFERQSKKRLTIGDIFQRLVGAN